MDWFRFVDYEGTTGCVEPRFSEDDGHARPHGFGEIGERCMRGDGARLVRWSVHRFRVPPNRVVGIVFRPLETFR